MENYFQCICSLDQAWNMFISLFLSLQFFFARFPLQLSSGICNIHARRVQGAWWLRSWVELGGGIRYSHVELELD